MGSYLISCIAIYVVLCYIMHKPFIEKKKAERYKPCTKRGVSVATRVATNGTFW